MVSYDTEKDTVTVDDYTELLTETQLFKTTEIIDDGRIYSAGRNSVNIVNIADKTIAQAEIAGDDINNFLVIGKIVCVVQEDGTVRELQE